MKMLNITKPYSWVKRPWGGDTLNGYHLGNYVNFAGLHGTLPQGAAALFLFWTETKVPVQIYWQSSSGWFRTHSHGSLQCFLKRGCGTHINREVSNHSSLCATHSTLCSQWQLERRQNFRLLMDCTAPPCLWCTSGGHIHELTKALVLIWLQ